jgi:hypothetical protein
VDAIFDAGTPSAKGHAGARQFALIAKGGGRQPHRGEAAESQEGGQAGGVQFVGFVDVAHEELGLSGVGEQGQATGGFDLIGDPVPIADALQGYGSGWGEF